MQKQKIDKIKEYKIENMQRYKNTKNKWLWKSIPQEGQNPHSQSLQMHFRKSLRCNNDNNNNEVCDPPVLKLKFFTFLKGHQFHPTTNSVF